MKKFILSLLWLLAIGSVKANFSTPGTGVKWTLDSLVLYSGGDVVMMGTDYRINDTIYLAKADTLMIQQDAVVKFMAGTYLEAKGALIVNPPNGVTFTAFETSTGYLGVRFDSSNNSYLKKLTFEYAVSMRMSDCSPTLDSCLIQYNNNSSSTTFGNGAIALFRSSPIIMNTHFISNKRAAIQGGANIANAPKIISCYFWGNNTTNQNVPQINMGASGSDTVKILNSQILNAGGIQGGGIGFLPVGTVNTVISGNVIKNNRYGITLNGGSNITAYIAHNIIDSNNIQNNPALGGSGIAFSGGSATSQQNSVVYSNMIRGNLWGITIQNRSKPNLGNLSNSDTTDDGKNQIYGNTNASTPGIDLYNNSVDEIYAQNNYWGTDVLSTVEDKIFHIVDNNTLGEVLYAPYMTSAVLPVELGRFDVRLVDRNSLLSWQTITEANTSHFNIQRSVDGRVFSDIAEVKAAGTTSSANNYTYTDKDVPAVAVVYYRLKMVDKDGRFSYSTTRLIQNSGNVTFTLWPNPAQDGISIIGKELKSLKVVATDGKVHLEQPLNQDINRVNISALSTGVYYIIVSDKNGTISTKQLIKN